MPADSLPEVVFLHLPRSEALETSIRRRFAHLLQHGPDLHGCRVVIAQPERHHRQGRPYAVRIEARLNGQTLVADRNRDEDVYLTVRDAFDDMERQVEDALRRRRAGQRARETLRTVRPANEPDLDAEPASPASGPGPA